MVGASDSTIHRLTDADHDMLLARHKGASKPRVAELSYALPHFNAIVDRVLELLMTTVISAEIDTLKGDATLAAWTRQGLTLHRDRKAEQCLFCDQSLPEQRLGALKEHFNVAYERLIQRINQEIQQLETASDASEAIQIPSAAALYDHLVPEFQSCERSLREALVAARGFLAAAVKALEDKKRRALERIKPELERPPVDGDVVRKLNAAIRKHNGECDAFETGGEEARSRLARHMIATELEEFIGLRDAAARATADWRRKKQEVRRLDDQIAKLEREIVEHRQPAEDLNEDLRKYLGHSELSRISHTGKPEASEGRVEAVTSVANGVGAKKKPPAGVFGAAGKEIDWLKGPSLVSGRSGAVSARWNKCSRAAGSYPGNRAWICANAAAEGCAESMATLTRRTETMTRAPILRSLSRSVPAVARASWVP